jgi:hypothetical protein
MLRIAVPTVRSLLLLSADAHAAVPPASAPADAQALERARVVQKGKRLGWIGLAFCGVGLLVSIVMRQAQLSAAPWGGRTGGGATLTLRF